MKLGIKFAHDAELEEGFINIRAYPGFGYRYWILTYHSSLNFFLSINITFPWRQKDATH